MTGRPSITTERVPEGVVIRRRGESVEDSWLFKEDGAWSRRPSADAGAWAPAPADDVPPEVVDALHWHRLCRPRAPTPRARTPRRLLHKTTPRR